MEPIESLKTSGISMDYRKVSAILLIVGTMISLRPDEAWALQTHGAPEGLLVHQMAHVLFAVSMAILAYWLESNRFVREKGWRLIQVSCLLFLLWNLVALTGHFLAEKISPDLILGQSGSWNQHLVAGKNLLAPAYYVLNLDHLVCVPAILCLVAGIRKLYSQTVMETARGD